MTGLPGAVRAWVWHGGAEFRPVDLPVPALAPGEAFVELAAATVCGSDRHTVSGRRPGACPSVLGHEGVGVVVAHRGARTVAGEPLRTGQRVVFGVTSSCGRCMPCRRGLTAKCEGVRKVGHESWHGDWPLSGAYASHILLRAGLAVVPVPDSLGDGAAATAGCAVATVMAVLERAGDLVGRSVLVSGLGMLGTAAVAAALDRGAAEVRAVDLHEARRATARALGAALVTDDAARAGTVDVALELSGAPGGVAACLAALDVGGTAVLAGSVAPAGTVPVDPEWLVRGWRTVTGVHNYEPRHLQQAVDFLATGVRGLPWSEVLGGPITPEELAREFAKPSGDALRTVVEWRPRPAA
ncbi:zinc-binding dehydrogenase [Kocuria sp.]|uniref:zinc-binding dehydrogenase n=1 Tax=Kocuria sp. TaxID=1871328 RepID=UPI0026DB61ED|nr:zinc-binding dehydrogenase [Kocuria sp.]MDO4918015.1 zinc-binding dehydrogenase [Kocuria sp.]